MVRPRVGDFIYTKAELNVMLEDIKIFKRLGVTGIVFGVLDCTHAVNVSDTQMFDAPRCLSVLLTIGIQACEGSFAIRRYFLHMYCVALGDVEILTLFEVCFHRAFDMTTQTVLGADALTYYLSLTVILPIPDPMQRFAKFWRLVALPES